MVLNRRHLMASAMLGALPGRLANAAETSPVVMARSREWQMPGSSGPCRIRLAWPEAPPPAAGHPLLLILDGDAWFATAVEAQRATALRPQSGRQDSERGGLVICALGFGTDALDEVRRRRNLDYTPPAPEAPPGTGGGDALLDFIETSLLPQLGLPIDPDRRALFGHSYGGLLALHAFFTRPTLFAGTVAASPSIWWHKAAVLQTAQRFIDAPPPNTAARRLLLTAGELEQAGAPSTTPESAARLRQTMMVERSQALAERLAAMPAGPKVQFTLFAGEDHGTVVSAALARAVRFASAG